MSASVATLLMPAAAYASAFFNLWSLLHMDDHPVFFILGMVQANFTLPGGMRQLMGGCTSWKSPHGFLLNELGILPIVLL